MPSIENPRQTLLDLFHVAVQRAMPLHTLGAHLPVPPAPGGRTVVLGAGKAAAAMALALETLWPAHVRAHGGTDTRLSGLVVTRYGHLPPRPADVPAQIEVVEAAHPVPDEAGLRAAQRMLEMAHACTANDLVICLISGGGSSLLTWPCEGLSLADKQRINRELLHSGADIGEMNTVRKHLSRIKGGRLAQACAPARVVTLAISDVPGDDPAVIASGPTVADASTCDQALDILRRHQIQLPTVVRLGLTSGALESVKPGHPALAGHRFELIATPAQSLQAAAEAARALGLNAYVLSDDIEGESREVGKVHAALARAAARGLGPFQRPCVILSGGETTVTVRPQPEGTPRGRGGRAGEFCMGLAQALQGQPGVWGLAADTDGIDGVEDNAGALVAPDTLARAQASGLSLQAHLDRNDAYGFFHAVGDLVVTGPTNTNVNDFRAMLVL
jgi:glycerate 2-kinase